MRPRTPCAHLPYASCSGTVAVLPVCKVGDLAALAQIAPAPLITRSEPSCLDLPSGVLILSLPGSPDPV
jgi:hypothetical protein